MYDAILGLCAVRSSEQVFSAWPFLIEDYEGTLAIVMAIVVVLGHLLLSLLGTF